MAPSTEMAPPDAQLVTIQRTVRIEEGDDAIEKGVPRVISESNFSTSSTADIESESDMGDFDVLVVNEVVPSGGDRAVLPAVEEFPVVEKHPEPPEPQTSTRRRSSALKHYVAEEIPIKDKGWRNLPKPDLKNIPKSQTSVGRSISSGSRVSFKSVEFRCHDQCVGDNPSVSIGTPVSLDWKYEDMDPIDFEAYESQRENNRRNLRQMMMNYFQRRTLLNYRYGIPEEDLDEAEKAANKIRHQRSVTRALLPTFLIEDLVTSAARKTKRVLKKKTKNASPEVAAPIERPELEVINI